MAHRSMTETFGDYYGTITRLIQEEINYNDELHRLSLRNMTR